MRDFSTSPHFRYASKQEAYPGATGDAFLQARPLVDNPEDSVPDLPGDFIAPHDESLFSFLNSLHVAVRERCASEQLQGAPLAQIVVQVREMVRLAEEAAGHRKKFPAQASQAILRQALAWCVEEFHPPAQPTFTTRISHE